jgi:hypothetical protein
MDGSMSDIEDKNIKDDYEYSRATYYELLEKGREGLDLMMEVARESEHPRAFEVLSAMMKNMADINGSLMDLQKKKKDVVGLKQEESHASITNNNVFIGSTTDLQRMLLESESDKEIIDVNPSETQ